MIHFEDLWNETERTAGQLIDKGELTNPIKNIENIIDKLQKEVMISAEYDINPASKAVGEILWELCVFCEMMSRKGKNINSFRALYDIMDAKRKEISDAQNIDGSVAINDKP